MYCRVMEEIEEVVGDKTTVEADDLDKLTYLNQVHATDHLQCCVKMTFTPMTTMTSFNLPGPGRGQ